MLSYLTHILMNETYKHNCCVSNSMYFTCTTKTYVKRGHNVLVEGRNVNKN